MPIYAIRCTCGKEYDALVSFSVADPAARACPDCGKDYQEGERLVCGRAIQRKQLSIDDMDPDDIQEQLENKAYYESLSEEILDGRIVLDERGPKELRPQCPDHLRKRMF